MGIFDFFHKLVSGESESGSGTATASERKSENCSDSKKPAMGSDEALRNLEDFVEYVVKALVDYPDEVRISTADGESGKMIQICCRASDRGKIIGKKGKTIMALRSLAAGAAGRSHNRISVEVLDDEEAVKD